MFTEIHFEQIDAQLEKIQKEIRAINIVNSTTPSSGSGSGNGSTTGSVNGSPIKPVPKLKTGNFFITKHSIIIGPWLSGAMQRAEGESKPVPYRVNLVHEDFGGLPGKSQQAPQERGYREPDLYAEDDEDDDKGTCIVEELPNSIFKLTMHVPQAFYGGIIGFKGSTKRCIESETQTDIFVPRSKESADKVAEDVSIKASLRKRMRPTHFLVVPLNTGEIKEKLLIFNKQSYHLTLGTYVLLDDTERAKAVEILQTCRPFLADLKIPFEIKVAGLEIMNDDPSSVRVLYANVIAPDLQQFADHALRQFRGSDNVKLHMTLLNNRYRKDQNPKSANNFDTREILKRFANYNFGTAQCSEVQICVLGSSRVNGDKSFYKVTGGLKF